MLPQCDFIKGHFEKSHKLPVEIPHMWEKLLSKLKDKVGS